MLQYPAMPENDTDDGRAKPYEWLDPVFPYDVDGEETRKGGAELVKHLLGVSSAVRDIAKMDQWDPCNVNYILRVEPNGYWEFRGEILSIVSRETERAEHIRRDNDPDWDLEDRTTEVVEAVTVSDRVMSASLLRMQEMDRRSILKMYAGHALRDLTREMDTSFPSLELEQRRLYVRTAYEHVMRGIVAPGFDPSAVPAKGKSAIMPPQSTDSIDYSI